MKKAVKKTTGKKDVEEATKKKKQAKLTKKDIESLKASLLSYRNKLTGQVNSLKTDSLSRDDEVNIEEDGTDAFERQFALSLASTENDMIFEIDEALKKIENNSYGKCMECGANIEINRLRALPFTKLCINCQSLLEKKSGRHRPII